MNQLSQISIQMAKLENWCVWQELTCVSNIFCHMFPCNLQRVETVLVEIISVKIKSDTWGANRSRNYYKLYGRKFILLVLLPVVARELFWRKYELLCTVKIHSKTKYCKIDCFVVSVVPDVFVVNLSNAFLLFLVTKVEPQWYGCWMQRWF